MLNYHQPVFRPPAEAYSAIIQVTLGCSWNKCAFCEMYQTKKFKVRPFDELKQEIRLLSRIYAGTKKIFLADGNAMVLSTPKLLGILSEINSNFGRIQRVSSYALPKDILSKTDEELLDLKVNGLKLLYVGIESGDDELLKILNKGESYQSTIEGILKAHKAGIETSVMIINGLGGKQYSNQHAIESARLINSIEPKFLSSLNLSFPYGLDHFKNRFKGHFEQQTIFEILKEMKLFISALDLKSTIYRSDHVSNQLILKGVLSKDKQLFLNQLDLAIDSTPSNIYPSTPLSL